MGSDAMKEARESLKRKRASKHGKRKKSKYPSVDEKLARLLTGQEEDSSDQIRVSEITPSDARESGNDPSSPESRTDDDGDDAKQNKLEGNQEDPVPVDSESESEEDSSADEGSEAAPENGRIAIDTARNLNKLNGSPALSEKPSNLNVIVLLEGANLETIKVPGRTTGLALLNSDDHQHILKKTKRDANDARPDILHQCLLTLLDSPLNKAGKLKVYVRSAKKVLIEIHPQTRIPRTIRRFYGLIVELLQKFKVRGTSGSSPLLKVIRNPITSHLPVDTRKIVCTYNCENIVDIREHAQKMAELGVTNKESERENDAENESTPQTVMYVVGAMAHGKVTEDWAEENICISEYPLSASTVCARITYAYECLLGIL